jgi:hypothetical protein
LPHGRPQGSRCGDPQAGRIVTPDRNHSPPKSVSTPWRPSGGRENAGRRRMEGLIYLVGLVVVIMAILSFFGLR